MSTVSGPFDRLRSCSRKEPTSLAERRALIRSLQKEVASRKVAIRKAVAADFNKSDVEADVSEIVPVLLEARFARKRLRAWMAPKRVAASFPIWGTRSYVIAQPKGIVLIISPWNYPFALTLGPLISAIAAGNRVILKPSELTPNSTDVIREIVVAALGLDWCAENR